MYSKTCPIPVKNVRDKLIETTPLSNLLSDWTTRILNEKIRKIPEQLFSRTILEENHPILFLYLNTVIVTAGTFEP